jgi:hypothetical protein
MKTAHPVDTARVELFLSDLRLPAIKQVWAQLAEQSDKEGWPAARFLAALAEHEIADRGRRRIERHLAEARRQSRDRQRHKVSAVFSMACGSWAARYLTTGGPKVCAPILGFRWTGFPAESSRSSEESRFSA